MFPSFYGTFPVDEIEDVGFPVVAHFLAPGQRPIIGTDKDLLPFVVPCPLKSAPFTGKTLLKALAQGLGAEGKQRSSNHMTAATWLILDVEVKGLTKEILDGVLHRMREMGISYVCYSTFNNGGPKGVRARLVLPLDKALEADEYPLAWHGADQILFDGGAFAADPSGSNLHQQQGVHVAPSETAGAAFCYIHKAGVASADALIAEGVKVCKPKAERREYTAPVLPVTMEVARLKEALPYLDAEKTPVWTSTMVAWKALVPVVGYEVAQALAVEYSEQAPDSAKAKNDDPRYSPAAFFDNCSPTMPAEAAKGCIYGSAKAGATTVMLADSGKYEFSEAGHAAALYLCKHHHTHFEALTGEVA
jgi:hypothetical protein